MPSLLSERFVNSIIQRYLTYESIEPILKHLESCSDSGIDSNYPSMSFDILQSFPKYLLGRIELLSLFGVHIIPKVWSCELKFSKLLPSFIIHRFQAIITGVLFAYIRKRYLKGSKPALNRRGTG